MSGLGVVAAVAVGVATYLLGRSRVGALPADLASHAEADRAISAFASHVVGVVLVVGIATAWIDGLIGTDALLANLPKARERNAVYFAWTTVTVYVMYLGHACWRWLISAPQRQE